MPPFLFRKPVKLSEAMFAVAIVSGVGFTFEFAKSVWMDTEVNGNRLNLLSLPLLLLVWNVLPLTFFAISKLLQRQGK